VSRPQQLILVHASVCIRRAVACFSEECSLLHQLGFFLYAAPLLVLRAQYN
jgi:hypothetical protein